jgi:hypothetical protein
MPKLRIVFQAFRADRAAVPESLIRELLPLVLIDNPMEGIGVPDCAVYLILADSNLESSTDSSHALSVCTEILELFDASKLTQAREAGLSLAVLVTLRSPSGCITLWVPPEFMSQLARLQLPAVLMCDLG